jgi:WW domain
LQVKLQEATRQRDDLRASGTKSRRKSLTKAQKSIPVSAAVELQHTPKEVHDKPTPFFTLTDLSTAISADRHDLPHTPRASTAPARARSSQSPSRIGRGGGSDSSRAREVHTSNGFEERGKRDTSTVEIESHNRPARVKEAHLVNPSACHSAAQDEQHTAYLQYEIQSARQAVEYRRLSLDGEGHGTGYDSSAGSVKSSVTTPSECNSCSIVGAPKTLSTSPVQQKVIRRKTLWAEYLDPASGLQYYHNRLTKETTWDMPSPTEMLQLLPII